MPVECHGKVRWSWNYLKILRPFKLVRTVLLQSRYARPDYLVYHSRWCSLQWAPSSRFVQDLEIYQIIKELLSSWEESCPPHIYKTPYVPQYFYSSIPKDALFCEWHRAFIFLDRLFPLLIIDFRLCAPWSWLFTCAEKLWHKTTLVPGFYQTGFVTTHRRPRWWSVPSYFAHLHIAQVSEAPSRHLLISRRRLIYRSTPR